MPQLSVPSRDRQTVYPDSEAAEVNKAVSRLVSSVRLPLALWALAGEDVDDHCI